MKMIVKGKLSVYCYCISISAAEFTYSLLKLSFLSPIAAAKSLLNKKADVKVRSLPDFSAHDLGLFQISQGVY